MKPIICTVDVVLLTVKNSQLHVALLKRDHEPFAETFGLPGGYLLQDVDIDAREAATRVLLAKTGIQSPYLEQLETFTGLTRDPRGWSVSVAYYALVPAEVIELAQHPEVRLVPVDRLKALPFDHAAIIGSALVRLRNKSLYSSLPVYLCGPEFTIPQLQEMYQTVLGEPLNKVSFRRKLDELDMLEEITGAFETGRKNRPAQLYRLKSTLTGSLSLVERGLNPG